MSFDEMTSRSGLSGSTLVFQPEVLQSLNHDMFLIVIVQTFLRINYKVFPTVQKVKSAWCVGYHRKHLKCFQQ